MWHFGEAEDGVLHVRIDREGRPVNSFSIDTMNQLRALTDVVASRDDIKAVVFQSGKTGNFIAGADLYEIRDNATFDATLAMSQNGQAAFQAVADLNATTIAVISGVALGGGLEFAMACDYRVAADTPRTLLGLPEVHLGLMPGWGATVRAPELVGFERAIDMLLNGQSMSAREALEAGLVDRVVDEDSLATAVRDIVAGRVSRRQSVSEATDAVQSLLSDAERTFASSREHYPAYDKMLDVLRDGLAVSTDAKFELEANGIAELAPDPVTTELIRLFFLKEGSRKPPDSIRDAAKTFKLRSVGVVSNFELGESIACLFAERSVDTVLAHLGETDSDTAAPSFHHLKRTGDVHDLGDVSVAIEAVVDDLEAERGLFQSLSTVVHPDTVIASTSASFLLSEQLEGVPNAERVIGLRFYPPVDAVPLLEIVHTAETSVESLGAAWAVARRLGRNAVQVSDSPGFLVNRVLLPYLIESGYLLIEHGEPAAVGAAACRFGMATDPTEAADRLGLKILTEISRRLTSELAETLPPSPVWRAVLDSDGETRLLDDRGSFTDTAAEAICRLREDMSQHAEPPDLIARLIYPMINAGAMCLAEGVVASADDIDLALVLAGGFPAFRGGPMRYAEQVGLTEIVSALQTMADGRPRLAPSDALKQYAETGTFPRG